MKEIKLFINNEFINSSEGKTEFSYNPATGEKIASIQIPSTKDIDQAFLSAKNALKNPAWKNSTKEERADLLLAISEKMKERKNDLIDWEVKDSGSCLRKAKADIHNAASFFKVMSDQVRHFSFETQDEKASRAGFSKNFRRFEPVGVCAQIIPWNFPLVMAAWKIGPAIASGSTTVLKSALETPITAFLLAEIIRDSGLPKGVVNILSGGANVGEYMVTHPLVNKVAFTGSTEVGKKIMKDSATSLKRLSLELGGKSANIVMDDADLSIAVDGALYAFLYHSGQACDSGTRLLVHEKIYPEFKTALLERIAKVKVGTPEDPTTGYGPVINEKQFSRIMNYIKITQNEGGKLLFGGKRIEGEKFNNGYYIEPTLFEIDQNKTIFKEEIFGPVLGMMSFKTQEEAIELANHSQYGLAGAVWSKDESKARRMANQIDAGTVWINEYHLLNPGMPFGGYKESGLGREMGEEGLRSYLEIKHLWVSDCDERAKKPWMDAIF
jgi:aldehyde dehydrogenase (NAD+)